MVTHERGQRPPANLQRSYQSTYTDTRVGKTYTQTAFPLGSNWVEETSSSSPGSPSTGSYELIGTIDFNDVNAAAGSSTFNVLTTNYDNKNLTGLYAVCVTPLDVDVINVGAHDTTTNSTSKITITGSLNTSGVSRVITSLDDVAQTINSTFEIRGVNGSFGNLSGGNTQGEFNIYARLETIV